MAEWNPDSVLLYRWNYSWSELIKLYKRKLTIYTERRQVDYDFIVKVASACVGGKSDEGTYELDDGEGLDEMNEAELQNLKDMLGDDYETLYGDNISDD